MTFASDADLDRALLDLGRHVTFPATPELDARVTQRIRQQPTRRPWWAAWLSPWPRTAAVALAVAIVLCAVGLAVSPAARQAVADRLGIGGVRITQVSDLPTPPPTALPSPTTTPLALAPSAPTATPRPTSTPQPPGATLGLGSSISLEEAQRRFGAALLVPQLGQPDAVYALGDSNSSTEVSLVYLPRVGLPASAATRGVGLVLSHFRGSIEHSILAQKGVGPGTTIEEVSVGGSRALWIAGAPHLFVRTPSGVVRDSPARLAGNTLLWEQNGSTLRLESALSKEEALRLAESAAAIGNP